MKHEAEQITHIIHQLSFESVHILLNFGFMRKGNHSKSLKVETKVKISKKNYFFSLNPLSIPRDIPWHHWKNLLTSKIGRSGGFNFFTKSCQIWLQTSGGSGDLNFDPICKCHTILETPLCPYEALHNLIDLWGKCSQIKTKTNGQCPECKRL